MPLNLLKKYPELLELSHYSEIQRTISLRKVFDRDITNNNNFKFRTKTIRPVKKEGLDSMDVLFDHLTKKTIIDDEGKKRRNVFEIDRSRRLHWIKHHIAEIESDILKIFSYEDRTKDRGSVVRTYIYDTKENHVIILEPQRSELDYYLISAYYLNEPGGEKQIKNKYKKRLDEVY
ncbi:MAG: hypothetical protein PHE33_06480 [Bacteroidales bacterium]|nr:hypothetical protein [Bacteroidales bacterium]